uniref:Polyribonucleotide nucleotidyltransferase n=1 Tax=Rhabditophanes sp. KR3021 TaxID=114890 RepID=A0AC35TVP6_9BILA
MLAVLRSQKEPYCRIYKRSYNTIYKKESVKLGDGHPLVFESGHLARFADGAVVASMGENALLTTLVKGKVPSGSDFLGLTVEYKASAAAVGKIPNNFLRRELNNSDSDILLGRNIDRSLRPLIASSFAYPIQIICKPLAVDESCDSAVLSINGASAAAMMANIPMIRPVGAVRVAMIDETVIINPTRKELKSSICDILISGTEEKKMVMLEMEGKEMTTTKFLNCMTKGLIEVNKIVDTLKKMNPDFKPYIHNEVLTKEELKLNESIKELSANQLEYIYTDATLDKEQRDIAVQTLFGNLKRDLRKENMKSFEGDFDLLIYKFFWSFAKHTLRNLTINSNIRVDGRSPEEVRKLAIKTDMFKKLHGSAMFQRGLADIENSFFKHWIVQKVDMTLVFIGTNLLSQPGQSQVLSTITFDSPSAAFRADSISQLLGAQERKMFMHQYEFPGYATNEISQSRGSNRREIGHGNLAEKGLKYTVPEDFPYTIRLNTQVLESNGSTSMAAVCGGSLALRDAGVPITNPAAGIAMGLMSSENCIESKKSVILTDLNGLEDYAGDMDFKIAGTQKGFTAMQLDVKIDGLDVDITKQVLSKAKTGLKYLLDKMKKNQPEVRKAFKDSVPVVEDLKITMLSKRALFQNGAFNAKLIESETGVKITSDDELKINLFAPSQEHLLEATKMIEELCGTKKEVQLTFGAFYSAKITEIMPSGFLVSFDKNSKPHFISNFNFSGKKVVDSSVFNKSVGDEIRIQYLGIDSETGKSRLTCHLVK